LIRKRVIIVGAGIIGASMAYHLAKTGASVLVLDAAKAGGLATRASWAWLNASWGNPEVYVRLRRQALVLWRDLSESCPELPVKMCGSLTYDLSESDLRTYVSQHGAWGYDIKLIDSKTTREREPFLREVPAIAALCGEEGVAEPVETALALLRRADAYGARCEYGVAVNAILSVSGRVKGVMTTAGEREGDVVVCAAGVDSPKLLRSAGFELPLKAPEGLLIHTRPLPSRLSGLLIAPGLHVRQTMAGRLVSGFDFAGSRVDAPDVAAARLLHWLNEMLVLPELAQIDFVTVEKRPTPADDFPTIGWASPVDGLYVAVMHSGMTLASAVGHFGSREILEGHDEPLFAPYRPGRFAS
jgi:glycine/D-amino acid oxidase-like deaminating enzyme